MVGTSGTVSDREKTYRVAIRKIDVQSVPHWTISATGWGWALRPAKRNENRWDWAEWRCWERRDRD